MNKETSFTPGPWKVKSEPKFTVVYSEMNGCIMMANHNGAHAKEQEANANLIAAAPDMFEVIDAFLKTGYYSTEVGNKALALMEKINPSYGKE
jgi:hypothetical protein